MLSRRLLLALAGTPVLTACGFQLRQAPQFSFRQHRAGHAGDDTGVRAAPSAAGHGPAPGAGRGAAGSGQADVVLESPGEQRERTVVSVTATGEVREFQLRIRLRFRLRTPEGRELLPMSEIVRQIDQSYSESAALSKEQEALMLYQNLQSDIVQQVMRRLATVSRAPLAKS